MNNHKNLQFSYSSSTRASLFDIIAEESLRNSLKPAWEYFWKTIKAKYPRRLWKFMEYSDEIFYCLLFLVEEYSLRKSSASVTESFYELVRESTAQSTSVMFRRARLISLFSVVLMPYLMEKFEKHYTKLKEGILCDGDNVSAMNRVFFHVYPVLQTIFKWIRIGCYILYLLRYTNYADPWLYLTSFHLKYADVDSYTEKHVGHHTGIVRILHRITDYLLGIISKLMPLLFYSIQFLETFYQEGNWTQAVASSLTVQESPAIPKVLSKDLKLPPSKKQCPLCQQVHVNPTTTPMSGFVFCYSCLYRYIEKFKCCPITYRSCSVSDLISLRP